MGKEIFNLKYSTTSKYGEYQFYYNPITGKLQYIFKYFRLPKYGNYIFCYDGANSLFIDDSVIPIIKTDGRDAIVSNYSFIRKDIQVLNDFMDVINSFELESNKSVSINNPTVLSNHDNREIDFLNLVSLLEMFEIKNAEIEETNVLKNHSDKGIVFEEDMLISKDSNSKQSLFKDKSDYFLVRQNKDISLENDFVLKRQNIYDLLKRDEILAKSVNRFIELEKEDKIQATNRNIGIDNYKTLKSIYRKLSTFDANEDRLFFDIENGRNLTKATGEELLGKQNKNLSIFNREEFLKDDHKKINLEYDEHLSKYLKTTQTDGDGLSSEVMLQKGEKNSHADNIGKLLNLGEYSLWEEKNEVFSNLGDYSLTKEFEKLLSLGDKNSIVENTEKETYLNLDNLFVETLERSSVNKEKEKIREEIEQRLNLHKRFWFLKNIGEIDIKILPNKDYIYPLSIEILEEGLDNGVYVYKHKGKYKELGNYSITLYQEDLTVLGQHNIDILDDYNETIQGISIKSNVQEIEEDGYNYEVEFEISINVENVDYVVIKQPKGFKGNEFVFLGTEKFIIEHHPIPIGEDLGRKEVPISISIMVDFINILLLLWAKRYLAFSGMTGTQAILGMVKLVNQWVTLETSLEEESIEEYHRCYRWFRWESEKVYNKAKLDPNLTGNYWIEEVIFEMIDYMEMHHFNNIPEWRDIERMDEQRNIFNDPQLDIPVVLDKFKGIRKRVIDKNKRLND